MRETADLSQEQTRRCWRAKEQMVLAMDEHSSWMAAILSNHDGPSASRLGSGRLYWVYRPITRSILDYMSNSVPSIRYTQ